MTELLRIDVDNGKYAIVQHENGGTEILRYGEPWMGQGGGDFPGVNAVLAIAYELEELRGLKDQVSQAMAETAPSWGWRIHRVLAILGLDFGSPDEIDWGLLRDAHRTIRDDPDAMRAAMMEKDWPPLGWKKGETS